ncbi:hypothetical protein SPRG_18851 [Saprolegnia parasitica CBS 223.65]|uniref:Uncharacterized protein n=1 Tax=Saprolegnia parasitica (strain CBS 223.65) TaxID=695850 RepID=A0A067D2J7_SAPPC|nr:hypothetical protein SPRG_18851 [Saprolegnia parasitica CBS 223.65]KDO35695.1 hypothetical protein SPRG_18851 [Saprolegnia parasitica CBS 223.65]|eukprot:XP_012194067.1 hypothetical protein SPRG_18851 [Saprolegnia parasitica CBS 223.65]
MACIGDDDVRALASSILASLDHATCSEWLSEESLAHHITSVMYSNKGTRAVLPVAFEPASAPEPRMTAVSHQSSLAHFQAARVEREALFRLHLTSASEQRSHCASRDSSSDISSDLSDDDDCTSDEDVAPSLPHLSTATTGTQTTGDVGRQDAQVQVDREPTPPEPHTTQYSMTTALLGTHELRVLSDVAGRVRVVHRACSEAAVPSKVIATRDASEQIVIEHHDQGVNTVTCSSPSVDKGTQMSMEDIDPSKPRRLIPQPQEDSPNFELDLSNFSRSHM